MKKVATWIMWITFVIAIIVWGMIGVKILEGNSEFFTEACIGTGCFLIIIICILNIFIIPNGIPFIRDAVWSLSKNP